MIRKLLLPLLIAALGLAGLAAWSHFKYIGRGGAAADAPITVVDLAGHELRLPGVPRRIALVRGREIYELAALLGDDLPNRLISLPGDLKSADYDAYRKFVERFPSLADLPGSGNSDRGNTSAEAIIALKPDLVILDVAMAVNRATNKFEEAGVPVIYLDWSGDPWRSPQRSLLALGKALGVEARAQEIVAYADRHIDTMLGRLEHLDEPAPRVYLEGAGYPLKFGQTYSGGPTGTSYSSWGQALKLLKVQNVSDRLKTGMGQISPEYVLTVDPQVIVLTGQNWTTALGSVRCGYYAEQGETRRLMEGFLERPGWRGLDAVKNGRIHTVFHNFSMHIFGFAGLEALAKDFYPRTFADLDPEQGLREFHEKFMPISYSGVWMTSLR